LVSVAVVGHEPRAEADVVVKDVEAWLPSPPSNFSPTSGGPPTGAAPPVGAQVGGEVAYQ
jgi:hypothetical protein